jgi:creatinine amidohydrolase
MMKQTSFLKELSWQEFLARKEKTDLAIIPAGAFEVYGPHLPLGADTLVSVKFAELVAERVEAVIGPVLEVGDSAVLDDFPGTITIKPESFKVYLQDIVDSLKKWGFKDFLFMNTHLHDVFIMNQVGHELQREAGIRCAQIDIWRFVQAHDKGLFQAALPHAHASECGTSVLMYLFPELCDMSKVVNSPPKFADKFPDVIKYLPLRAHTDTGTIGDATLGTAEKGRELVDRCINRIVEFLVESWGYPRK